MTLIKFLWLLYPHRKLVPSTWVTANMLQQSHILSTLTTLVNLIFSVILRNIYSYLGQFTRKKNLSYLLQVKARK